MKKYVIMAAMLLGMCVSTFASDYEHNAKEASVKTVEVKNGRDYDMSFNHRRLACTLGMTSEQMEMAENVFINFDNDMYFASTIENEITCNKAVYDAIIKNLKYMSYILKDDQYKKYRMLLNTTLRNKGFELSEIAIVK